MKWAWTAFLALLLCALPAQPGEFVELPAVADTTLIEYAPTNNMGGHPFINAGSTVDVSAPGSALPSRNRALLRFDLSRIPRGSRILRAELHAEMTGEPRSGSAPSLFSLHRLLRPWGEGAKVSSSGSPGLGRPATEGEATWISRFAQSPDGWSIPGGAPNIDFVADVSSTRFIEDPPPYEFAFPSSAEMVANVQLWVDNPGQNFGWMLRSLAETTRGTARRFGAREDSNNAPRLVVEFAPPFQIESIFRQQDQVEIRFHGSAGQGYRVDYAPALPALQWHTLEEIDPLPSDTAVTVTDPATELFRVYRVSLVP